ncbi:DUF1801 domain-containing protein [Kordiimonas aquimaris]|uniref:DUF1801 domain-containing protein n=1 Tax=Kordiimonas aquimaris TaxID=707591 RepID=UPI0021CEDBF7|nr:DUF1801 domain-containing protein [Kordiimonas aquimaris]
MATFKTQQNDAEISDFLASVENVKRREDAIVVCEMIEEMTGWKPMMWGPSIIGFGAYEGKTGRWMITGLSPRKASLSVYIMPGFSMYEEQLQRLGKHKTGKCCLYINKLEDIDIGVLKELIQLSIEEMQRRYTWAPE